MQDIKNVDFKRRRTRANILLRAFVTYAFAALLVILAVITSVAAWGMYGRMILAGQGEDAAKHQLSDAEGQQQQVAGELQNLSTERGVEGELRSRYGVAKPGEGEIELVEASAASTTAQAGHTGNIFINAWNALFGWW
jgi:hypothetical protein